MDAEKHPPSTHLIGVIVQIVGVLQSCAVRDDLVGQLVRVGVEVSREQQQVGTGGGHAHELGAVEALHQPVATVHVTRLVVVGVQLTEGMAG